MADHGDCPLTEKMLYVTKFLLDGKLFDIKQSVDSRHDQPFFMSHRSDPATLDLESPE